ncbi:hypothetical protein GCM10018772_28190 [Streptomyces fumanus]|uniref:Uncharacterized protein n=1 Tax=Streptomyces fumanus TaxID=67302 RepID=A0A919E1S9_9ACTN|nr:hypothetical protein GCM10018772_28190 [Streptomyces fumanus]
MAARVRRVSGLAADTTGVLSTEGLRSASRCVGGACGRREAGGGGHGDGPPGTDRGAGAPPVPRVSDARADGATAGAGRAQQIDVPAGGEHRQRSAGTAERHHDPPLLDEKRPVIPSFPTGLIGIVAEGDGIPKGCSA